MALFAGDPFTQADQVTPTGESDCAWIRVTALGAVDRTRPRPQRPRWIIGVVPKKDVYLYL